MHVQDAAKTLPNNDGGPPWRPTQPEKTMKAVKAVGLSKHVKHVKPNEQKPPIARKSVGFCEPGKSVANLESSTRAEVAKKNQLTCPLPLPIPHSAVAVSLL